MVSYAQAIISGVVQGLTEFLPISSSGHLVLVHDYFGYNKPQLLFDIILHVATLFAVLAYFRRDIVKVLTTERRLLRFILIGSIPTAIIGFTFKDTFELSFGNVKIVGLMLFLTAGFLFAGESAATIWQKNAIGRKNLGWFKALIIGLVQGLSIMPGLSRSGSTIATGLLLKLDKKQAVRFSFLLAIPAIIGALLFKLTEAGTRVVITPPMLAGGLAAFLVGLGAIYVLLKAVYADKLSYFGIYCVLVGGAILIL